MTSLTEAYQGNAREATSLRRLYAGTGLVLLGAVLSVVAVLVATTDLAGGYVAGATTWEMPDQYATVRVAGVLAGLGVPAALIGLFSVLPAGRRVRAAGAIGSTLCLLGVALFWGAYPHHWRGYGADLTLEVSAIYLVGLFVAVWCLFVGVVNFKTRNDPGGTLEMNVTREPRTIVDSAQSRADGVGGVGLLGETPDGDVETQTNVDRDGGDRRAGRPTSDGGSRTAAAGTGTAVAGAKTLRAAGIEPGCDAEIVDAQPVSGEPTDRYCGNCSHFEYTRSASELVPYCTRHDDAMDGMDACEEWTPNRSN